MDANILIKEFQGKLIEAINNSNLPIGIVYFVAKDVFLQIENTYHEALMLNNGTKPVEEEKGEENG